MFVSIAWVGIHISNTILKNHHVCLNQGNDDIRKSYIWFVINYQFQCELDSSRARENIEL